MRLPSAAEPWLRTLDGGAFTLAMTALSLGHFRLNGDPRDLHHHIRAWAAGLCERTQITVRTTGADEIRWQEPHLLMANHQSYLDIAALYRALPIVFGVVAKRELYRIPGFGEVLAAVGCVAVDRHDAASSHAALEEAGRRVRAGATLAIFPEGTRGPGDHILPLKKGPFYLAEAARTPIVPIGIRGAAALLPRGGRRVRGGLIEVHVGAPIPVPEGTGSEPRAALRGAVRRALGELAGLPLLPPET